MKGGLQGIKNDRQQIDYMGFVGGEAVTCYSVCKRLSTRYLLPSTILHF